MTDNDPRKLNHFLNMNEYNYYKKFKKACMSMDESKQDLTYFGLLLRMELNIMVSSNLIAFLTSMVETYQLMLVKL